MSMTENIGSESILRLERSRLHSALRSRRYRRRNRQAERDAKRDAKRIARRIESDQPITTYADLVAYLVTRRKALGLSQIELDDRCGFYDGYVSHLENWRARHGRVAGSVAMALWFEALGVQLKPVVSQPVGHDARPRLNGADLARRPRA